MLSTLFSNYGDAMHGAIGSFLPIMFLSGIKWPLAGLPQILQKISWYLPLTAAVQAMRGVMARGWNIHLFMRELVSQLHGFQYL